MGSACLTDVDGSGPSGGRGPRSVSAAEGGWWPSTGAGSRPCRWSSRPFRGARGAVGAGPTGGGCRHSRVGGRDQHPAPPPVPAVRGRILDRHGVPLVANTTSLTVTMDRRVFTAQPTRARESLTALAALLHRDPSEVIGRAHLCGEDGAPKPPSAGTALPRCPSRWPSTSTRRSPSPLLERPDLHPGLGVRTEVARTFRRPMGSTPPNSPGYLGRVTGDEVSGSDGRLGADASSAGRGSKSSTTGNCAARQGRRSSPSTRAASSCARCVAPMPCPDATCAPRSTPGCRPWPSEAGRRSRRRAQSRRVADSAAAVVLDAGNGQVLASASVPTYDPGVWTGGITAADYARLTDPAAGHPLLSRVTGVTFPCLDDQGAVGPGGRPGRGLAHRPPSPARRATRSGTGPSTISSRRRTHPSPTPTRFASPATRCSTTSPTDPGSPRGLSQRSDDIDPSS